MAADIIRLALEAFNGDVIAVRPVDDVGRRFPDTIPGLGPKRIVAYTKCASCEAHGRGYLVTWRVQGGHGPLEGERFMTPGTWTAYRDIPLCRDCAGTRWKVETLTAWWSPIL